EPVRQLWLRLPGRRVRLDLAWPDRRLDLEGDGRLFHTSPGDRRRDAARDAAVRSDEWVVERATWLDVVETPDLLDARLRRWFPELAGERGPAPERPAACGARSSPVRPACGPREPRSRWPTRPKSSRECVVAGAARAPATNG